MSDETAKIIYTLTDEAPALATYAFLPIIDAFAGAAEVAVESRDISVAARILALFPDFLTEAQRVPDNLHELGDLCLRPEANIIKLPNVSASLPQLKAAIAELQSKGYALPDFPDEPADDAARDVRARYDKVKGSAVNPVLREGNSDRRAPASVKAYARHNPHTMGAWSADSETHVSAMSRGDFYGNEKAVTLEKATTFRIEHVATDGTVTVLKKDAPVLAGEVLDATVMRVSALQAFITEQIADAKEKGVLFSVHLKATMMKVSDPIIFGHVVRAFFPKLFAEHGALLEAAGINPNDGLGTMLQVAQTLPEDQRRLIEDAVAQGIAEGPALAMVDSDRGITNLHVPSDTIVDASMPAMIRSSGKMWNAKGEEQDCKAVLPDRSYAGIYQAVIDDCKAHGAYDPATMGSVPNVGLMAQAAEEYGSHDKTFEAAAPGAIRVVDGAGNVLLEQDVAKGDIFRTCQAKDLPICDWARLAVERARATGSPAVFWLDRNRAHDAQLIAKVETYLKDYDTAGLEIHVMAPFEAITFSLERIRRGADTISVTGNVLRDYHTDLFPIMELGTSAKMLSIVPLLNGGGLFETGAGGSAPKHVQQFNKENHLRWDSLGEFLALAVAFEHLAHRTGNARAQLLADTLDAATGDLLENRKSPSRRVRELDNRGSQFYLTMYWAKHLATQGTDAAMAMKFAPLAEALTANEQKIVDELNAVQGSPCDIGGYYYPDVALATAAMRPSPTFNAAISAL